MSKLFTYLFLIIALVFSGLNSSVAQKNKQPEGIDVSEGANLVKINVLALPISNFSFQYERALTRKISAAIGFRLMPQGGLPFKSKIKDLIDDEDAWKHLEKLEMGNFAITPEVRFYLGKSVFKGFYIAPFVRFANYNANLDFEFEYERPIGEGPNPSEEITVTENIPLTGNISSFTGGVMFGAQWKVAKRVYLDWWILGPHYGSSNGNVSGKKDLSDPDMRNALREELEDLREDGTVKVTPSVNESGARVDAKGPWGGLRAGLAIGYRF